MDDVCLHDCMHVLYVCLHVCVHMYVYVRSHVKNDSHAGLLILHFWSLFKQLYKYYSRPSMFTTASKGFLKHNVWKTKKLA